MEIAYNTRSQKAYYSLLDQLENLSFTTPEGNTPTHMHKFHIYGRETTLFIHADSKLVTYESTKYADEKEYEVTIFKPSNKLKLSNGGV